MEINYAIHWIQIYPVDSAIRRLNNRSQIKNYQLWLSIRETNCTIQWIEIYLAALDSIIHLLNTWSLVPVVQKLDSTIHGINLYPQDKY